MLFIVQQDDGTEVGVHADRLEVETTGDGRWRFLGPNGVYLELPTRKVRNLRMIHETWPDRHVPDEETTEPQPIKPSG